MLPLVSVVLPTYNRPQYLREAISSAVNQTYTNIEIIVSDNCSPNDPMPIIKEFSDSRIKFFRQIENIGPFANVMSAFSKASGKYVACLLDDDIWEENYLKEMVVVLEENNDAVLAFCDHYMANEDGQINWEKTEKSSIYYGRKNLLKGLYRPFYKLAIVSQSVSPAFAAVMRRDAIDWNSIPPKVSLLWDTYLAYLYSCTSSGAYYIPARLTRCREHSGTITQQSGSKSVELKLAKAKGFVFCYRTYIADDRLRPLHPELKKRLAHHLTTLGIALLRKNEKKDARASFFESAQLHLTPRTLGAILISIFPNWLTSKFLGPDFFIYENFI